MKTQKQLQRDYIAAQFAVLNHDKIQHSFSLKIHSVAGETNWLNVTPEQIEAIKGVLSK
jgi:hypothetical protein